MEDEGSCRVWSGEDGGRDESLLDLVKHFLLSCCTDDSFSFSDEFSHWFGEIAKVRNELAVVSGETEERLDIGGSLGYGEVANFLHLTVKNCDSFNGDGVSKEGEFLSEDSTFFWSEAKSCLSEFLEHGFDVMQVLIEGVGIDDNIVKVDEHASAELVTEDGIHEPLESCRSIAESKGHNVPFESSFRSVEACLLFVVRVHGDLPIARG